jgi:1,4-dihydroxy-2-naphthoyl-CoA synthase
VISGFRRDVLEKCALLGYYAARSFNFVTDVSGQPIVSIFKGGYGTDRLSRNIGKKLTLLVA